MDLVRVGVIGCGYWGPNLIRNLAELGSAELVVVADCKPDRLQHIKGLHPQVQATTDYRDMFSMDLNAVVVATPPATHFPIAKNCLEHGLHVMVEKPLTTTSEDAETLVDIAEQRGLILMTGNTFEYNSAVQTLKKLIDSGDLGKVYYIDAVRTNLGLYQPHVNVLWDLAPHDISILLYMLGTDPISVSAQGGTSIFKNIYDVVYLHLTFPDNILAHIHVSWLNPCKVRRTTVVGSKKMVVYDDVENLEKIRIYDKGVDSPQHSDTFGDFQCSYRYGDIVTPYIRFVEPLRTECQHFVECIMNGAEPQSNGLVGLKIVQILEKASISLSNGSRAEPFMPATPLALPELSVHAQEGSQARSAALFEAQRESRISNT